MFHILGELEPRAFADDSGEGTSPEIVAENVTQEILDTFSASIIDLEAVRDILDGDIGPFQNVFLQECEVVNTLLVEMRRSLVELNMGFAGQLTMSDAMEKLMSSLIKNEVPKTWASIAWPSLRNLSSWCSNLSTRLSMLADWALDPIDVQGVTWISGLVNPQSFLTAIMQTAAQATGSPLSSLVIQTEVTRRSVEDVDKASAGMEHTCMD